MCMTKNDTTQTKVGYFSKTTEIFNKVQLSWEGHKNWRNLPHGFDIYLIFVAFSEKLNFTENFCS